MVTIRPHAKNDLQRIWQYTEAQWGDKQADRYLWKLNGSIEFLAENPKAGMPIDFVRSNYLKYSTRRHIIVYTYTTDKLEIVRVLAAAMDLQANL